MHRRIATLIALLLALTGLTFVGIATLASPAQAKDTDCGDYSSQAAAQHYFDSHGGGPNNNVDLLDADGDGIACESNPCPCTTGGGGGGGGGGGTGPKPPHKIQVRGHEIKSTNRFEILGKISTFKNGRFQVQRKAGATAFRTWRFVKTNPVGKFRSPIVQSGKKKTCFRLLVPETNKNRKTISKTIGCISSG